MMTKFVLKLFTVLLISTMHGATINYTQAKKLGIIKSYSSDSDTHGRSLLHRIIFSPDFLNDNAAFIESQQATGNRPGRSNNTISRNRVRRRLRRQESSKSAIIVKRVVRQTKQSDSTSHHRRHNHNHNDPTYMELFEKLSKRVGKSVNKEKNYAIIIEKDPVNMMLPQKVCEKGEWACPKPKNNTKLYPCINESQVCDGHIDCPRGGDENSKLCPFYKLSVKQRFTDQETMLQEQLEKIAQQQQKIVDLQMQILNKTESCERSIDKLQRSVHLLQQTSLDVKEVPNC